MKPMASRTVSTSGEPLYRQAEMALLEDIKLGRWRPGVPIPTEKELAKVHNISQGTMRLAILELVKAGVLYRKQGVGTFIAGLKLDQSLDRFFRFELHQNTRTLPLETKLLGKGVVKSDAVTAKALDIKTGTSVGWLRRLRLYQDDPFLYYDSYFPLATWRKIADSDFTVANLYQYIQETRDVCIVAADEFLTPGLAGPSEQQLLGSKLGSPIVKLIRHSYGFESKKLEYRVSFGRGDRFTYHVKL